MKKAIGIGLAVALLAGVGVFLVSQRMQKIALESVLPAGPVFYMSATGINQRIEKLTTTKLFADLKSLDYKNLATILGVPAQGVDEAQQRLEQAFSLENQKFLKALFGQEVALAVYMDDVAQSMQVQNPQDVQKMIKQLAENVFIVTRVAGDVAVAETVLKFLGQFSKDFTTSTTVYHGKKINSMSSKDGSLSVSYVRFNDVLVMGVGQKAAQSAIDMIVKKQKSLFEDENFKKRIKNVVGEVDTAGFVDIRAIYAMINAQLVQSAKTSQSQLYSIQLKEQLKQTKGLDVLTFTTASGDVLTGKASLYFDQSQIDSRMRGLYSCRPADNHSAKFVPADALVYQWSTCLDFPQMWSQYKEQLAMQNQTSGQPFDINQAISSYEKMIGLSMDADILPVLGKEFGFYFTDVDTTGVLPIPKLVAFVQVAAQDKVTAIINQLLSLSPNLRPEEETYNGQVIRYIPIPFVKSFKVSYTFVDDYLLLATNVDILKASFDANQDPDKAIMANSVLAGDKSQMNSVFFVQVNRLMEKAIAVVDWAMQMTRQATVQRQAFLTGSQKNIDDIKARNAVLDSEIKTKKDNLLQLEATVDVTTQMVASKENLTKEIADAQKEIAANEERVKSLNQQAKTYQAKALVDDKNMLLIEQFVKPLLQAFTNIGYFNSVTINGDGVVQSTSQFKMQ
ncbi:MAG: hypothetical protein H6753_02300 [Candidatus Omnitrophica bacterium]|nr:hypothetical protein [Candidatus Omnitrophota bacterium]